MNDAENLSKLLGHLPPAVFREFMVDEFELAMPDLDKKAAKRDQRTEMETVLSELGINHRQRIEEVAERIVLLSDGAGQDVIEGFRDDIFDPKDQEAFASVDFLDHDNIGVRGFACSFHCLHERAINQR